MKFVVSIVSFVTLFGSALVLNAANYQEIFLQANKQYKEREYKKALEAYVSLPDKSTAVWYNSGNCLYHLGKYIDALVAFKRAERGATNVQRKAIDYNKEQTFKALTTPQPTMSYMSHVYNWFSRAIAPIALLWLQLLFLLFLYCAVFCMCRMYRSKKYGICFVWLTGLTFWCGIALGIKAYDMYYKHGIVVQQGTVFVGPDKKYDVSGTVMLADELTILDKRPEWYKVKKGKLLGWVPAELVAEID